jgi:integrase
MDNAKRRAAGAWVVDYVDQQGHRHIQTFERKKDADAAAQQTAIDVRAGVHTAASKRHHGRYC